MAPFISIQTTPCHISCVLDSSTKLRYNLKGIITSLAPFMRSRKKINPKATAEEIENDYEKCISDEKTFSCPALPKWRG